MSENKIHDILASKGSAASGKASASDQDRRGDIPNPEALDPKTLDGIITRMKIGYRDDGYFDKDARRLYALKDWLEVNARLIAAAPDLLEALKVFRERCCVQGACGYCQDADHLISRIEGTPPGRAEQTSDPSQSTEAKS